jgi:hypothetical protein
MDLIDQFLYIHFSFGSLEGKTVERRDVQSPFPPRNTLKRESTKLPTTSGGNFKQLSSLKLLENKLECLYTAKTFPSKYNVLYKAKFKGSGAIQCGHFKGRLLVPML